MRYRYKSIFIVTVDNGITPAIQNIFCHLTEDLTPVLVSSQQMHKIRKSLRGEGEVQGVVLMGKNTMVRANLI